MKMIFSEMKALWNAGRAAGLGYRIGVRLESEVGQAGSTNIISLKFVVPVPALSKIETFQQGDISHLISSSGR